MTASVKKEDRRDSEHDAICAWLTRLLGSDNDRPRELFGDTIWYPRVDFTDQFGRPAGFNLFWDCPESRQIRNVAVEKELKDGNEKILGYADLVVEYGSDEWPKRMLIEVKSSREPFSAGDVIRQIQTYRKAAKKFDRSVLVTTVTLSDSAKELLTHEGIAYWQLEWTLAPVPSSPTA